MKEHPRTALNVTLAGDSLRKLEPPDIMTESRH